MVGAMHRFVPTVLAVSLSTLGCAATPTPAEPVVPASADAPAPAPEAAAAPLLTLGAVKLFEASAPELALVMADDGSLTLDGDAVGSVTADGQMLGRDGQVVAVVQPDGSVLADGEPTGFTINDSGGVLVAGDKTMTFGFADDGSMTITPAPEGGGPPLAHEGCNGPLAKTCALLAFGLLTGHKVESTPPTESAAPTTP